MQYLDLSPVEELCEYDMLVNRILKIFQTAAIIMQPRTFDDIRDVRKSNMSLGHVVNILCVEWLKESSARLRKWESIIDEYINEFGGQWKYYAASKRIEVIKEYGGDESDYDENGEIRMEGLSDDDYKLYSVMKDLYDESFRDIIQDCLPEDLYNFTSVISAEASLDFREIFGDIPSYKIDDDGNIHQTTFEENEMDKAVNKADAENIVTLFTVAFYAFWYICTLLKKASIDENLMQNNVEFLQTVRQHIHEIYSMRLSDSFISEIQDAVSAYFKNDVKKY